MQPNLIERWENILKANFSESMLSSPGVRALAVETIAALSPTMPDDVVKEIRYLRLEHCNRAADMLEKQERLLAWQIEETKSCDVFIKKLEERIAELEKGDD